MFQMEPYTLSHNGKVERNYLEDQKRLYSCHSFYSPADFAQQLAAHNRLEKSSTPPMPTPSSCSTLSTNNNSNHQADASYKDNDKDD